MIRSPSKHAVDALVRLFDALSERPRVRLVLALAQGERSVGDLCEELGLAQSLVSHHLGLLRIHGLVVRTQQGRGASYALVPQIKATTGKLRIPGEDCVVTVEMR